MKRESRGPEQDDLLRPRLTDMIDMRHELVKLAGLGTVKVLSHIRLRDDGSLGLIRE